VVGKRADAFLEVMYRIEYFTLNRAFADLTDDEFLWEPTPATWSVRRRDECRTPTPFGDGDWVVDFENPEPDPVPLTSIAWLAWHVGSMPRRLTEIDFFGGQHTMSSGWTSPYLTDHPIFTTAADAVTAIRDGWSALRAVIEVSSDERFEVLASRYTYAPEPMRDGLCVVGPPGPEHSVTFFVAGVLNEMSHHATQMCFLRDLYAHRFNK
jgi:hypothetical protein